MRAYTAEVFADGRPIFKQEIIRASNFSACSHHAIKFAKPAMRRGTKQLTIRMTAIKSVTQNEEAN